uniref:NAD(P)-binding domain-containing protein n=1 Tax=Octactis speculum TaxID=3111310 RepID=A0A7S2B6B5_9STRA|mmetsp:Transcript_20090/g.27283  ORF Transcript_20090/g.27283 Transcript_20090/m.27283 type:complete len:332 (+) Transcript_20090:13-1008(+)|eukprot:CAMPEP_0185751552 /NCGR_PEP_ID=MMETSP1174-20130828/10333_1 /TAXON_ID=35687 /ORGANISM="Dictyocha speculum, Strain CCMP1381" /LENGTH=331 /DNA_ID=CAMNT_0028428587 /DNA_START=13 /DNA_END=1008 /DNA_ORIENTATION=+
MKLLLFLLVTAAYSLVIPTPSRRSLLCGGFGLALEGSFGLPPVAAATAVAPVLVLGANGGTGKACVKALLARSIPCVAATRTGELSEELKVDLLAAFPPSSKSNGKGGYTGFLQTAAVDVTSSASLRSAISRESCSGGVIFAASASTKGGDAKAVDRDGVVAAAEACLAADIGRYVVVSSGTVTRPDSAVYKLLEFAGKGIMSAKIAGEDKVRSLYADPAVVTKGLGYTIVRPGGLTNEPPMGAAFLELNQGDDKSGRLSREDVASLCVESLRSPDAFDATFECYNADTAKPVESVGLSNIMKSRTATTYVSGKEHRGNEWQALLTGLARD